MRAKGFFAWGRIESNGNCTHLYDPNLIGRMISRLKRYIINPQNPPAYPEKRRHRRTTTSAGLARLVCYVSDEVCLSTNLIFHTWGWPFLLPCTTWKGWAARHGLYSFHHGLNEPFPFPVFQPTGPDGDKGRSSNHWLLYAPKFALRATAQ